MPAISSIWWFLWFLYISAGLVPMLIEELRPTTLLLSIHVSQTRSSFTSGRPIAVPASRPAAIRKWRQSCVESVGGRILVYHGFRFRFHRHNAAGLMSWRCSDRRNCSCILTTNAFDKEAPNPVIQVINESEHSGHPCQAEFIHIVRFREDMRSEAMDNPTRPLKRIYDGIVAREHRQAVQGGGDRPQLPAFQSVRSTIRRARSMVVPEIPASISDVRIEGTWTETLNRDNFLLHLDNDWGFAIFATGENLQALRNSRVLYMDGTFRSCPQPYTQVFTILGNVRGFVVPLVTALMVNKTTGIYRQVLQEVIRAVRRVTHHNWRPHTIVADFEVALWNAVQTELPNAAMAGCHFHLTQSFWRRIQELGLARHYLNNQPLQNTIRKVMAIGYLPIPLLRNNFRMLMHSRTARRLMDEFPGLLEFFNYVNNTYILPHANFPPAVWNVYNRDMSQRTNNHAETYHRTLNEAVGVRHPSTWAFIRIIEDRQAVAENLLSAAERGDAAPPRRRKWRLLENRIQRLRAQYNTGERNVQSYWRAVARAVWPA